jgi:hypothetical protein
MKPEKGRRRVCFSSPKREDPEHKQEFFSPEKAAAPEGKSLSGAAGPAGSEK